ncbi:ABC transporter permease [Paradesertivirga mongoliensis]|uniref:ABC transporter permease n=1 Tax=Paradesertivirga mongoliensis TaxID=2100740 RepID=A0ABW4ZN15_9SPHI|nr:ABC transporter permease [Pedobacter mongoliensis]
MEFYLTAILQALCFSGLAIGIFISMKIFNIPDITTDGSFTLGGAITGVLLMAEIPPSLSLLVVMSAGALAGAFTGFIHAKLNVNPLLAGILVMTALYSVNLSLMGRSNIPLFNISTLFSPAFFLQDLNQNTFIVLLVFVVVMLLVIGYLLKTDFGIAMRATGNSETMIKALGVNTNRMKIIGLAMANSLTALSGYLITQFQGFADINMGIGIVIVGLGSVIIGETLIHWLKVKSILTNLVLVIAGAVIFQLVLAVTLDIGVDANLLKLVTASFVLLIVSLPRVLSVQR